MYAVIKTGGKQYRVAKDEIIAVEKLAGEAGASLDLSEVLMLSDDKGTTIGSPLVEGASVSAEVVEQTRGDKIIVFKKKRRKNYRRKKGHQQDLTLLRITDINAPGAKRAAKSGASKTAKKEDAEPKEAAEEAKTPDAAVEAAAAETAAPEAEAKTKAEPKAPAKSKTAAPKKKAAASKSKEASSGKTAAKPKAAGTRSRSKKSDSTDKDGA